MHGKENEERGKNVVMNLEADGKGKIRVNVRPYFYWMRSFPYQSFERSVQDQKIVSICLGS